MVFSFFRRPKADLSIELGRDVGIPGEEVLATVTLTASKDLEVRDATVYFECRERYWKNEYDTATKSVRPKEKSRNLFESSQRLMTDAKVRSGIPVIEQVSFRLPDDAHRTVEGKVVRIDWRIRVGMDIPGARDLKAEQALVVEAARSRADTTAEEPAPLFTDQQFDECRLRMETEKSVFAPGEPVAGSVLLDAQQDCSFDEIRVELIRSEEAGDQSADDRSQVVSLQKDPGVRAGLSQEWRFEVDLPETAVPSMAASDSTVVWKLKGVLARSKRRDYSVETQFTVS